ncbi:MAG: polysaccharide deacetylase family protein, partial [Planctomycetaceae bacterium]
MPGLMKQLVLRSARGGAFAGCVALLERLGDRRANLLRVLTYHRIDEPDASRQLHPGLISATPAEFTLQMEHLASRCRAVSMQDALAAFRETLPLPPRSVLITFDDAYADFAQHAWPVLRRLGLPATLFVPTAYPDRPQQAFWWDRLHRAVHGANGRAVLPTPLGPFPVGDASSRQRTLRRLSGHVKSLPHRDTLEFIESVCNGETVSANGVLGWAELRRLAGEGLTLAPHSRTHPLFSRLPLDEARAEAVGSRADLEREIGPPPPVFAYPSGAFTAATAGMLREEGFELAFTTRRGVNAVASADPLRLRRINVGRHTSLPLLR